MDARAAALVDGSHGILAGVAVRVLLVVKAARAA
jgi:hypothetical protein